MTLASVKVGDIVRAEGHYGLVRDRAPGKLLVRWLGNGTSERWVKAREVETHWRRAGRSSA